MVASMRSKSAMIVALLASALIAVLLVGIPSPAFAADDSSKLTAGNTTDASKDSSATKSGGATATTKKNAEAKLKLFTGKGIYYISLFKNKKKALAMKDDLRVNNVRLVVSKRRNTNLMKFKFIRRKSGAYYIKNVATGRLLTADIKTETRANAVMRSKEGKRYQMWKVYVNPDKSIRIINIATRTSLNLANGKYKLGTKVNLRKSNEKGSQKFYLRKGKRNKNEKVTINVPCYMQNPQLPTGCEAVALTNALNYWGCGLSKTTIADHWLLRGSNGVYNFIGNPRDWSGWIICAPGLANTAHRYLASVGRDDIETMIVKDEPLWKLCHFIDQGYPVVVWTTIGMGAPGSLSAMKSGYPLRSNNHAVVLTGYNPKTGNYQVADSLAGIKWRDGSRFGYLYAMMGRQALVVHD